MLMAVYWMTEALPLAVTSFFPLFLFPLLEVRKAKDVGPNYLKVYAAVNLAMDERLL
jgi:sodium-dependent dicarboxylate transporter 2/3/5